MVNFYNTLLVISTVNCGEFLQYTLSNFDGDFINGLGLRKLDCELWHIYRNIPNNFNGVLR